jgi:hypothetical protein
MDTIQAFLLIASVVIAVFTATALGYEFWVEGDKDED